MQIREINIEGFGVFSDKQVTGLTSGLNVIYGENEAGKTTLIEFIRRILFEVLARSKGGKKFNPYPPLNGGRHGGSLKCQLAGEDVFWVTKTLAGKNEVQISPAFAGLKGQPALDAMLSHASINIFQNIFAFTLDELQSFDSLEGDEIKNRIYGAELGLGDVSLKQVEKILSDPADEIFLPRGKKTATNFLLKEIKTLEQEIRDIQNQGQEFDRLTGRLESLETAQAPKQKKIESLEAEKRTLETRKDLYKVARELIEVESAIKEMGEVLEFPSQGLKNLETLVEEQKTLLSQIDKEESEINEMRIEQGALPVNHDLLSHTADVTYLQQSIQSIKISLEDTEKLQQKSAALAREIEANLLDVGGAWDEEKVVNFTEFNPAKISEIQSFSKDFENLRVEVAKARGSLEDHEQQTAKKKSAGWRLPLWLQAVAFAFAGLGVAGLIWGWVEMNVPLLAIAVGTTILGGILFWKITTGKKEFVPDDHLEKVLQDKLGRVQSALDQKKTEWRAWLKALAFDETLDPLSAQEFGNVLKEIKGKLLDKAELERRIAAMRDSLADTQKRIDKIKTSMPENSLQGQIPANIKFINELFEQSKENRNRKNQIDKQIETRVFDLGKLKTRLQEVESSLKQMIEKSGVADDEDYRAKHEKFVKRNLLQEQAEQKRNVIQMRIGGGPRSEQFLCGIESHSPDETLDALTKNSRALAELDSEKSSADQKIGETRNQLEQLASNDEMLIKQGELENKIQTLRDCTKEWAVAKLALGMLESAKKIYEKNRQPGVLKSAEAVFSEITDGKYPRLVKPLDEDEVFIQNVRGAQKKVSQTSRGTREQLYLSMRLGLIEEYESRSESLPIVMDDVLVNFDDSRKAKVIAALTRFSRGRQVIVLTCHEASLAAYMKAGATRIEI
jgi:uncharacterized protein YhaN